LNVLQLITPSRFSGAEIVCVEIAAQLRARGHRVEVATKRNPQLLHLLADRQVPYQVTAVGNKFNLAVPLLIARLARRAQADVIHTHLSTASLWGSYAGRLAGIPVVSHVHALNTMIWYRWATRLIAVSNAVKAHVVASGIPADRVDVVYNAVELDSGDLGADPLETRRALGIPADAFLVVVVAHLSRKKGHPVLLEALRQLVAAGRPIRCVCLGEGRRRGALEAQRDELGLSEAVQFLGFRDDARAIMDASDVVVLPPVAREGLGLALLEAGALGKPSVGTRLGGIPEAIVDGETGILVEPGDADALGHALTTLMDDAGLRQRMGEAAQQHVRAAFSHQAQTNAIERVYQRAIEAMQTRR
jgi:glycosyltransferase involved in cell wall biosynthesis